MGPFFLSSTVKWDQRRQLPRVGLVRLAELRAHLLLLQPQFVPQRGQHQGQCKQPEPSLRFCAPRYGFHNRHISSHFLFVPNDSPSFWLPRWVTS